MKLKDLLERVDMSESNKTDIDTYTFCDEFDLDWCHIDYQLLHERLSSYWVEPHLCTDTWVGIAAIFFDGKLACISHQDARKSDTTYRWLSDDAFNDVKAFLLSIHESKAQPDTYIDLDEEVEPHYTCNYGGQVLEREWETATFQGQSFEVVHVYNWEQHKFTGDDLLALEAYPDVSSYADCWVRIKVDGVDRLVPVCEIQLKSRIVAEQTNTITLEK